ncbi:hypothetical protein CGRA01v4_05310 [Colletotrichum graminicola]|uniref:Uncharacterized protein n=1 Tax=Colletotrichum graminicola (strain M1.001 / M2 / FGSC 10212) TaxID=645133 RepID=E3Q5Y6_COLGM|nr:uncharacterized protein GLRG_01378 [Colletotrichum graminicola M1.001]EFQ26234.1 hypothetical protein GLRG_01378 [Colletotrichum graminicola M1.001]WDK14029.1 hypothetical protein CGRA01v4_05310 [Colletotrichum graminicola]
MSDNEALTPPRRSGTSDPGAHDLANASDSDDHFSDAQSAPLSPGTSPIPKTRVEKVDDEPSYGEVPGTEAYRLREGDAEPDEIAIQEKKSDASSSEGSAPKSPVIPKTVVEEAPGSTGPHSEEFLEKRKADAPADLVVKPEGETEEGGSSDPSPVSPALSTPGSPHLKRKSSRTALSSAPSSASLAPPPDAEDDDEGGGDDFGDDFDDFEEGAEADGDFDDFDDGFQEPEFEAPAPAPPPSLSQVPSLPFHIPDFDGLDSEDVLQAVDPYLNTLFPPEDLDVSPPPPITKENPIFLTPRSASLWSQLVAPPPLAPPDWIRSRIRRLFLVSLGVPVDLDEILPASKQKKLVLPSLQVTTAGSPRTSSDIRSVARIRQSDANASSTSVDSKGKPSTSKKKGPPPVPDLDLVSAKQLCATTDEALNGMTDEELKAHVEKLKAMEGTAREVLEYWTKKTDEKIGDREAFEGVIENLVKHARKVRK